MSKYFISSIDINGNIYTGVVRLDEDGQVWSLGEGEQDPEYLAWVAEGNEAQTWE